MKNSTLAGLMGGALALSLGTNGYLFYQNQKTFKNIEQRNEIRNYKDSIDNVMTIMQDSLQRFVFVQEENSRLASKIEDLENRGPRIEYRTKTVTVNTNEEAKDLLNQIAALKSQLKEASKPIDNIAKGSPTKDLTSSEINELNKFKSLVDSKDEEIANLKLEVDKLRGDRETYALEYASDIKSKYDNLKVENTNLKDRVSRGAIPQFGPVTVSGGYMDDGIFVPSYKASKIERLQINFSVLENALITEPLTEKVTIRILNPQGAVISTKEINGNMTNIKDVYTRKADIQIDADMVGNSPQQLYFPAIGNLPDKLSKGNYKVELISRGQIRQVTNFQIN